MRLCVSVRQQQNAPSKLGGQIRIVAVPATAKRHAPSKLGG
jgi:hypothetical protein